ncbi:MAG: transketolase [Conexibacter sp.]|nr:transketolase [Conexibacter sp.]
MTTVTNEDAERIRERARFIREETIRLISIAKVGHYASAFSCAELLAALYYDVLRLRPQEPGWPDRDRFLFGKGHAAVGWYPILADLGYFPKEELDGYTRLGSPFGDHPDMRRVVGCDFSSGSLGHALSTGLGMAIAGKMRHRDYRVFVMLGDGELHEGQIWEAAMAAGHRSASNLIAIVDRNEHCLDGRVDDIVGLEPLAARWEAFGWSVSEVDGHDPSAVLEALRGIADDEERTRPAVLIAHTVKGKGVGYMESEIGWHLGYLVEPDEQRALAEVRGAA